MSKIKQLIRWIRILLANNEQYIQVLREDGVKIGKTVPFIRMRNSEQSHT